MRSIILEMNSYVLNTKRGFFYSMINQYKNSLTNKETFVPFNVLDIYYTDEITSFRDEKRGWRFQCPGDYKNNNRCGVVYTFKDCTIMHAGANSGGDRKYGFICFKCGFKVPPETDLKTFKDVTFIDKAEMYDIKQFT
jgi:hypothetical protein